jgi:hypothetical protein
VFNEGGEEEISRRTLEGKWLTDLSQRHHSSWFLGKITMAAEETLKIEVFTGYQKKGEDTQQTFTQLYRLIPDAPVREIKIPNVGYTRIPLLKGRLLEISTVSKRDLIEDEIAELLDEEGM